MIISANFKTFKTKKETENYLFDLNQNIKDTPHRIIVFPPITALQKSLEFVKVGTQNSYPVKNGAFTGEIGLEQLNEFEINTILIGHSERREIIGETQEFIAKKFQFFKENNFEIIYCIGENLETRNKGQNNLFEFLKSQFNGIDLNYQKLIIAYEPIWAIGTGITPNIEQIDEILSWLHNFTKKPVIYGGSVKPTNAKNILQLKSCNGVLVGSASLDLNNFLKIIKIAN